MCRNAEWASRRCQISPDLICIFVSSVHILLRNYQGTYSQFNLLHLEISWKNIRIIRGDLATSPFSYGVFALDVKYSILISNFDVDFITRIQFLRVFIEGNFARTQWDRSKFCVNEGVFQVSASCQNILHHCEQSRRVSSGLGMNPRASPPPLWIRMLYKGRADEIFKEPISCVANRNRVALQPGKQAQDSRKKTLEIETYGIFATLLCVSFLFGFFSCGKTPIDWFYWNQKLLNEDILVTVAWSEFLSAKAFIVHSLEKHR